MTLGPAPRNLRGMDRLFFALGAAFAFLGVALGAFGAHVLTGRLPADRLAIFEVGVRYQMYHALGLLAVAWAWSRWPGVASAWAGWLFTGGIIVFSGTLYLLAFGAPRWWGAVTPLGGLAMLGGWVVLGWSAVKG